MNEKFKNQYDFTDSVIESIEWTDNMHNIKIYIDYKYPEDNLAGIKLIGCNKFHYNLNNEKFNIPYEERDDYIWSWHNILSLEIKRVDELYTILIKNNSEEFIIMCVCHDVEEIFC